MAKHNSTKLPQWDLSQYYSGIDDPKIFTDLKLSASRADQFRKKYHNNINNSTSAAVVLQAIQALEVIYEMASRAPIYTSLVHSTKSNSHQVGSVMQRVKRLFTELSSKLVFFDLSLSQLSQAKLKSLANDPKLRNYQNYFHKILLSKPHRLSEAEEVMLANKSLTGRQAFLRLFDQHMAARKYEIQIDGKRLNLLQPEVLDYLHSANAKHRKAASEGLTAGLKADSALLTYIFNTLAEDKNINDKLAQFETPEAARHIDNEITQKIVNSMSAAIKPNYKTVQRYYNFKRKKLKAKTLFDYDRYAPVGKSTKTFTFTEAKNIVLGSFNKFSPEFGAAGQKFFDSNWIDAEVKPGKRGGAYCLYGTPQTHPVVFMNFMGKANDVSTLAHELGHGINAYFMRAQTVMNFDTTLVMAETASVFAEMLVFDDLKQLIKNQEERQALYMEKIENIFSTVFRQHAMYQFEQRWHDRIKNHGELSTQEYNQIWRETQSEMYGNSVKLTENYDHWWSYIPHFLHTPFYVYAYAFGELLVLSLYAKYKQEGQPFVDKYLRLMQAGDTASPQELLAPLGIKLDNVNFWRGGLRIIDDLVDEAIKLK